MKATALAFLLFLTVPLVAQERKPQAQAQCKFSDGSTIRVTHISESETYELASDEELLTVKGTSVPAGHYSVLPAKDPRNDSWTLKMRSESMKGESRELPPLPLSVVKHVKLNRLEASVAPVVFTVSFDQTGGSCMMHWRSDKPNMVLSLEFAEKNTDLPLAK